MNKHYENYFGSIYIGPDNPTVIVDGKERPDYRREPKDELDNSAITHDISYDFKNAAGIEGALFD